MSEENNEQVLELNEEQLQELLGEASESDTLPPIEIPMEWFDDTQFHKGIHDISYVSGQITALLNCGVSESFVLDFLLNRETVKHNLDVAKINSEMNVQISKNHKVTQDKYEL